MYLIHELPPFLFSSALLTVCVFFYFFPHLFSPALAWSILATRVFLILRIRFFFVFLLRPYFFLACCFHLSLFPSQFFSNWPLQGCVLRTTLTWNVDRSISLAFKRGDHINRTTENTWQPYSADLLLTYYMTTNQLTFFPTYYYCYTILLFHYSSPSILSVSSSFFTDRNNFVFFFFFFFFVSVVLTRIQRLIVCHISFFSCLFGLVSDRCAAKTKQKIQIQLTTK